MMIRDFKYVFTNQMTLFKIDNKSVAVIEVLTHWDLVTDIFESMNWTMIGLSSVCWQMITWTKFDLLSIGILEQTSVKF